jgi:hypothetical protein
MPSQIITIGENANVSFVIPNGWMKKRATRIASVTPITVLREMSGETTWMPCTAPKTDCAGVRTPSAMTIVTAKIPITCKRRLAKGLDSRLYRAYLLVRSRSIVGCLFIWTSDASRGSRFVMFM